MKKLAPFFSKTGRAAPLLYVLSAVGTVLLALLLLAGCTLLPQKRIDRHVLTSAAALLEEGVYPRFHDYSAESQLDNYTDAVMIEEARATTRTNPGSILTNPRHTYEGASNPTEALAIYAEEDADSPAGWYYARYWMGFRVLLRLWLVFFDYLQIRRYLSFVFYCLFFWTLLSVSRHTGRYTAFLYGLSILLVRPQTISSSMQFSCCFFILFPAMLLTPAVSRRPGIEGLFFFVLGMVTQYFDFYTTPILTFGYPMVYLCLLYFRQGEEFGGKRALKAALLWLAGYVFMWLAKLALTTWLTDINGFENGFLSMFTRMGIRKDPNRLQQYNPLVGLYWVIFRGMADDWSGLIVAVISLFMLAIALGLLLFTGRLTLKALAAHYLLLVLAFSPIVWFIVTAQPTANHYWFQYRSIALAYWAFGAWIVTSLTGKASAQPPDKTG